ncbi:type-F conjugative transfer system mating-pair stabilization protein TraN [Rouxiella silvae]|uniref:Type-F conjugative transfer system mating-pair stabilization protein TraN n=1 Tax=Rouxiella silvae TaxID=1646373 RepID=A0ABX3TVI6_9GAMM|nr:type-F conjugative transfer system mating-pair stabilization protein TraN [Rouxiella silvae]ORJ19227.1 type-F conjugative transfer system mating-pair stabilization protein TraN [Rouxiella silvae]
MNKRLVLLALLPFFSHADDLNSSYSAGSNYALGVATQGSSSLSDKDPSTMINGYSSSPSQESYYGGVTGSDGNLSSAGSAESTKNSTVQTINSAQASNPATAIDPSSTFITAGKGFETNASTITDGTNTMCSSTSVTKSTFQNYSCDRDLNDVKVCSRTATVTGHYVDNSVTSYVNIDSNSLSFDQKTGVATYTAIPEGTIISATLTYQFDSHLAFGSSGWYLNVDVLGQKMNMYEDYGTYTYIPNWNMTAGQPITFTLGNKQGSSIAGSIWQAGKRNNMYHFTLALVVKKGQQQYVTDTSWSESCDFDKSTATAEVSSTCVSPGGDRTVVVDGQTYTQYSDCWQYQDEYVVPANSTGNCDSLIANKNCTVATRSCTSSENGTCLHEQDVYQCETDYQSSGVLCGGTFYCQSGDCGETQTSGDNGFSAAVSKLAAVSSAGSDIASDSVDVKAFTGSAVSCRKAMAGFSNCCLDKGWGNSIGLSHCNDEEKALGTAKSKKLVIDVGETCSKKVLGVCLQKKEVYCQFEGKLARIVQQQGRQGQLGISFGSADSPNCRGITVEELQSINFDKIDFSDFYSDLESNENLPDDSSMVNSVKSKIASQVNQMEGK